MEHSEYSMAIQIRGLVKQYGAQCVVDGVDLSVKSGECFGLLGPNGAGKTTTLRMLLGSTSPSSGDIKVLGYEIPRQAREMRSKVGLVPQLDNLDPDFTVTENLYTYASYFGLSASALQRRVEDLLQFASLEHKANAKITSLSGGMQRRLTLARALVNDPQLVVLDEPTTGLDPQARHVIWQRLRKLINQGTTVLLTTHYMEEAQRLCDRIAIMDHGKILAVDTPQALIKTYIEPHVVEVYGDGLESWLNSIGRTLVQRLERAGETVYCYVEDEQAILRALHQAPELQHLVRPANLEDVFLKLTGRDLRDA